MFKEKIVLITGGSSGIGRATAILFAEEGADIVITYKSNKKGANEVVDKIIKIGRRAVAIKADLVLEKSAKNVIEKTIKKFGKIDILVNNAGRYIDGDEWNGDSDVWIKSLKQNLISVMSMSKHVAKIFQKQGRGVIINVASIHGISGHADAISYGAAKAGIINITQSYSKLLSPIGCRVNSVSPSAANTGYWLTAPKDELAERLASTPNNKLIEPEEIAGKIVFLASDEAQDINGQNIVIE
jgi:3-oxoacyl-[acyl-carrier protein] reductase